jgi:hypothetical protein
MYILYRRLVIAPVMSSIVAVAAGFLAAVARSFAIALDLGLLAGHARLTSSASPCNILLPELWFEEVNGIFMLA